MNTETGEIKAITAEEAEKLNKENELNQRLDNLAEKAEQIKEKEKESGKWKEIPVGKEITIEGLEFVIAYVRVDTQEVVLRPKNKVKMKLNI